jgi:hypothetical protein
MTCEEATKLMDGYLDGELDPITGQTIGQDLRGCRNCEQAYRLPRRVRRTNVAPLRVLQRFWLTHKTSVSEKRRGREFEY